MAKIGQLVVDMALDSATFIGDLGKVERNVESSSAKMNVAMARISKGFNGFRKSINDNLGPMLSFKGIISQLAGAAGIGLLIKNSLDAADHIAKVADAVGLTTSQLQAYQFAANQSGISTEQFNTNMQVLIRNTAQAQLGTGGLVSTLQKFNPVLLENITHARSQNEVFRLVADAIKNAGSQTEAAAIATAAFGKAGIPMINMLRGGTESLNEFAVQAQKMGLILSEDLIRQAETAGDKLSLLGDILQKKLIVETVKLSPQIIKISQNLLDMVPVVLNLTNAFISFFMKVGEGWQKIIDWIMVGVIQFQKFTGLLDAKVADNMLDQIAEKARKTSEELKNLNTNMDQTKSGVGMPLPTASSPAAPINKSDNLSVKVQQMKELGEESKKTADIINSSFSQALSGLNADFSNWRDVAMNALSSIAQGLLKQGVGMASQSILNGMGGGSGGGGSMGASIGSAVMSGIGSYFNGSGGGSSFAGFFAEGGKFSAGQSFIAGEKGPELITAAAGGQVVPMQKMGAVNVTMNVYAKDANSFKESQSQIAAKMAQQIQGASRNL